MQKVTLCQKAAPVATIQLKLFGEKANSKAKKKQYPKNGHYIQPQLMLLVMTAQYKLLYFKKA